MRAASGSEVMLVRGTVLEARNLVLSFGETPALRGASLTVKKGEVLADDGAERLGQVDAAPLLGGHPRHRLGEITSTASASTR